uniref:Putative effector protein n=1 Tax=Heterodera avenae TaxID=34510 RepID=A0A2L0VDQ5_HETAV|nr:putative effector protein [Heterodera avenae]
MRTVLVIALVGLVLGFVLESVNTSKREKSTRPLLKGDDSVSRYWEEEQEAARLKAATARIAHIVPITREEKEIAAGINERYTKQSVAEFQKGMQRKSLREKSAGIKPKGKEVKPAEQEEIEASQSEKW